MTNQTETTTKKLPSHDICIVTPKKGSDKAFWQKVSVLWEHKDKNGFDMTINGVKYTIRKRKPRPV